MRLSQGKKIGMICLDLVISGQGYYRRRRAYGGLKVDQARRLKYLEKEESDVLIDEPIIQANQRQFVGIHRWWVHALVMRDDRCTIHSEKIHRCAIAVGRAARHCF